MLEFRAVFDTLTFKKVWNLLILQLSFLIYRTSKWYVHWGRPATLTVEPTNHCNLACLECPSGTKNTTRSRGHVPVEAYTSIIQETNPWLTTLILHFQGEPFLHKQLFEMIENATKKNIYTMLSTNGYFLNAEHIEQLLHTGLHRLIVSFDGMSQESYTKYRVHGDLNKVMQGVQELVQQKKNLNMRNPVIELQFIVFRHNEHEIQDFLALKNILGVDIVNLKTAQIYEPDSHADLIPENKKYARYRLIKGQWRIKNRLRNACWRIWSGLVVTHDLQTIPCCFDKDASHGFGDLTESGILEVWANKALKDFRRRVFTHRKEVPMCCNCTEGLQVRS